MIREIRACGPRPHLRARRASAGPRPARAREVPPRSSRGTRQRSRAGSRGCARGRGRRRAPTAFGYPRHFFRPASAFHRRARTPCPRMSGKAGRWTNEEHAAFVAAMERFGQNWRRIHDAVPTRSVVQIRTHAQVRATDDSPRRPRARARPRPVPSRAPPPASASRLVPVRRARAPQKYFIRLAKAGLPRPGSGGVVAKTGSFLDDGSASFALAGDASRTSPSVRAPRVARSCAGNGWSGGPRRPPRPADTSTSAPFPYPAPRPEFSRPVRRRPAAVRRAPPRNRDSLGLLLGRRAAGSRAHTPARPHGTRGGGRRRVRRG